MMHEMLKNKVVDKLQQLLFNKLICKCTCCFRKPTWAISKHSLLVATSKCSSIQVYTTNKPLGYFTITWSTWTSAAATFDCSRCQQWLQIVPQIIQENDGKFHAIHHTTTDHNNTHSAAFEYSIWDELGTTKYLRDEFTARCP